MAFRKKKSKLDHDEAPRQYYKDQLFPDAVEVTLESRVVSAGRLQSMLRIGSIRAVNLMKELEEQGIIGPERGNRPREIFYTMERWNEEKENFVWKPEPPKEDKAPSPPPRPADHAKYCPYCDARLPKGASSCWNCKNKLPVSVGQKIASVVATLIIILLAICFLPRLASELPEPVPVMSKSEYIDRCRTISYEKLARNPDSYKGDYLTFVGEVIQVVEFGNEVQLRVNVTEYEVYGTYYSKDTIFVTTKLPANGSRILEKDIIRLYGVCEGLYTYTSIWGASISIPGIYAEYWEIV